MDAFYGDSIALRNINLEVRRGQRVALLGRNGAGKSSLLKSIVGGGPSVKGSVTFDGVLLERMPTHLRIRRGLALVPEDRRIFPHITVEENLLLAHQGARAGKACRSFDESCALFPVLGALRERKGTQLSGGQQQILAVARGLVARPDCLLLDEPTEGVAPLIVEQMATQVAHACNVEGTALLVAEQNVWFARQCSDYVYVMDTGSIVFHGTWQAYDAQPEIAERYLAV
ncbi:MAG: ABC transporter ATP-binding protein [Variovorax sp.]